MSILRHTDHQAQIAIELIHGVEVQLVDLTNGKIVIHKTFTSLDDKRDARAYFDQHVEALKVAQLLAQHAAKVSA
jgi:hypothetical protein